MSAIVGFSRAFTETLEQDWQQNERQQGGGDQTADHDDGERPLDLRSRAAREQQRHKAEGRDTGGRSEEHTSELQSLMRSSYAVFCLKKKKHNITNTMGSKTIESAIRNRQT